MEGREMDGLDRALAVKLAEMLNRMVDDADEIRETHIDD